MQLAVVVGQCTATVKDRSLEGRKLALVRRADTAGAPSGEVEVALDVTGAGSGQLVLLARGSAARQPTDTRQLTTDLTIVAIVDEVTTTSPQGDRSTTPSETAPKVPPTKKKAPSNAAARTRTRGK